MSDQATDQSHDHTNASGEHFAHVGSLRGLFLTFGTLIFLTVLTVVAASIDLDGLVGMPGGINISVALIIAGVKATLVALFFMHMIHEKAFNVIAFVIGLLFVMLFLGLLLSDTMEYQPDISSYAKELP